MSSAGTNAGGAAGAVPDVQCGLVADDCEPLFELDVGLRDCLKNEVEPLPTDRDEFVEWTREMFKERGVIGQRHSDKEVFSPGAVVLYRTATTGKFRKTAMEAIQHFEVEHKATVHDGTIARAKVPFEKAAEAFAENSGFKPAAVKREMGKLWDVAASRKKARVKGEFKTKVGEVLGIEEEDEAQGNVSSSEEDSGED